MSTMLENMFGLGADLPEESEINVEDEFIKKITEGELPLEESSLSINDLKTFYNTSDSIDKDKYPNFFEWYDYMVRSGKYHNESVEEDGKEDKKDKILNEEDPSTEEEISEYNDLGIDTRTGLKVDEYECPVCGEVVNKNDLTCRFCDSKLNESLGYDINEYQEWVDYDMKHYGKISDETNRKLNDAGLEVVKDDHGDYEVIAKDRKELGESVENSEALECAQMSFEAGHRFEENDFGDPKSYNKYLEYMEMGPAGFYEEFKDELDFDEDFIAEYGEIDESLNESTFSRIAGAAKDAFNKFKTDTMFEDDKYGRKLLNYVDKFKKEFNITEKTHYNSFSYTREQGKEYRTYHAYIDNVPHEITHQFVSEKYSSDTKPEYLSRGIVWFLDPKRKANYELEDGEIQTEINPESIHFYLRVVVDAEWGQKDQDKRYAKYHKKLGIKDESLKESTDSLSRIKKKFYSDNTPAGHLWKAVDLTDDEMSLLGHAGYKQMNDGTKHSYVQLTDDEYKDIFDESLKEDTVKKSNDKWTNRGDDGKEHGEFKTKKAADAQRKAMFANGYKAESLTEEKHPLKIEIPKILFYGYLGDMEYDDGSVMSPDEVKSAGFKVKDQRVYLPAGIYEAEWFKGKGAPAGFDFKMKDGQWYPFVSNSRNEEGTVYKIIGKKYEESFKLSLKEDVEETLPGPDDAEDLSLSNMISKGIKDEYNTIELYNSLSLLAKEQGRDDIAELVDNINTEENNHVGMLQQAFKTLSENGDAVESGDKEAEEYLDEPVKLELKDSNDFKLELR